MPQLAAPPSEPVSRPPTALQRVALVGNPNTGKTTVFNRLCGARAKTANFPGTTAAMRVGRGALGAHTVEVVDLPGVYQLHLDAPETRIVRDLLAGRTKHSRPDAVVVVADASNLARNLILVGELVAARMPIVVCLNMTDVAAKRQTAVDALALGARLGATVVPTVASKGIGMEALRQAIAGTLAKSSPEWPADVPAPGRDLPGHRRVGRSRHGRDRQRRRERRRSADRAARSRC